MWKCQTCGAEFDEPDIVTVRENLDGERGVETRREGRCPCCGGEEIDLQ